MEVLREPRSGDWLRGRLAPFGGAVGAVAGTGFEAYARLLHPLEGRRLSWDDAGAGMVPRVIDERPWTWAEVAAALGGVVHPCVQWESLVRGRDARWDDGWEVSAPEQGWLDPAVLAALVPALAAATATPESVVVAVWNGWGELHPGSSHVLLRAEGPRFGPARRGVETEAPWSPGLPRLGEPVLDALESRDLLEMPGRAYLLLGGALAELADPAWGYDAGIGWDAPWPRPTPQLVWPRDRSWVIASEIDFDSTLVAGSRALVDRVLAAPGIEAVQVAEDDDLSRGGDLINR